MPKQSFRSFLVFLVATVLAGVALILTTSAAVGSGGNVHLAVPVVLAAVVLGCGIGARRSRPDRARTS